MKCLVFVKFLPVGSIQPDDFFERINAEQHWFDDSPPGGTVGKKGPAKARSAMCIADFDSVQQLSIDLAIMPGAIISNVEVVAVSDDFTATEFSQSLNDNRLMNSKSR